MKYFTLLFLIIVSHSAIAQFNIVNKTEKLLSKEKYNNALQNIIKAIEKDSTNAAAYQAFAFYFSYEASNEYQIDSAHYYNLSAIERYENSDEKSLQRLNKNDITTLSLQQFKKKIDSIAFQEATQSPSIVVFNHYIGIYTSSRYLDSAILWRNQIAFDDALSENTYHSYKSFMEKYPEATQVEESKARFEKLYFDESVKDGQLDSYLAFLEDHPMSVHRSLAEQQILELSTLDNSLYSYLNFANSFPASSYSKIALDYAYHINKVIPSIPIVQKSYYDSLQIIDIANRKTLYPYYNNGFGFIDDLGKKIISTTYQPQVVSPQECPKIYSDFIELKTKSQLVTKSGDVFWTGDYDTIVNLGTGLIAISKNNKFGVIHKTGRQVLPMIYEDVSLLNNKYLSFKENGLWGLYSSLGRLITEPIFQSVTSLDNFILIKQSDKWAVTNSTIIAQSLETPLKLSFNYDEYESFGEGYLMVYQEDNVNLISENLHVKFSKSTVEIASSENGLISKDDKGYHLFDSTTFDEIATSSQPILSNEAGTFYQTENAWNKIRAKSSIKLTCDSLQLINDHFVKYYYGDSIGFTLSDSIKFHKNVNYTYLSYDDSAYILINKSDSLSLITAQGKLIQLGDYDKVWSTDNELLIVEKNQQKGLITTSDVAVLFTEYDAIQKGNSSTYTLLQDSKFGIYNIDDSTLIVPTYDERLKIYNDSLYIVKSENLYGLVDHENDLILPLEFDQIQYWNDTSALVKKGYQWIIYDIHNNRAIIDKINQYELIENTEEVQVLKIYKENGYGIIHNNLGEITPASFYNIHVLNVQNKALYVAEKYIEEADFYVVVYYNTNGEAIFKHAMESQYYQNIKCEIP